MYWLKNIFVFDVSGLANIVLAFATIALAYLTSALVKATNRLDEHEENARHRNELTRALLLAEQFRNISARHFVDGSRKPSTFKKEEAAIIRNLYIFAKHINDSETKRRLKAFVFLVDQLERFEMSLGDNVTATIKELSFLQDRMMASIIDWREELTK